MRRAGDTVPQGQSPGTFQDRVSGIGQRGSESARTVGGANPRSLQDRGPRGRPPNPPRGQPHDCFMLCNTMDCRVWGRTKYTLRRLMDELWKGVVSALTLFLVASALNV